MAKSKKNKTNAKANKNAAKKKEASPPQEKDPIAQSAEAFYLRGDFAALRSLSKAHPDHAILKTFRAKADTELPVWLIGLTASCIVLCAAALTLTMG